MNPNLLEKARRLGLSREQLERLEEADLLNNTGQWDASLRRWIKYRVRHRMSGDEAVAAAEAAARNIKEQRTRRVSHGTGAT